MTEIKELKFRKELLRKVYSGKKIATTRISHKFREGDKFHAVDEEGKGDKSKTYVITEIYISTLEELSKYLYREEGYLSSEEMCRDVLSIYSFDFLITPSTLMVSYVFEEERKEGCT